MQASTLNFLKALRKNNNKLWFDANKEKYLLAKEDMLQLVEALLKKMVTVEPSLKDLQAKDCLFRINRDIRFSKDKTPYKYYMSAALDPGGKKSIYAGFYFHVQPGNESYCGGGIWSPQAPELNKVRQEIDYCLPEFKKIISAPTFKKYYGSLAKEEGQMLVNLPKGFEKDNPAGEYLRFKSYIGLRKISDEMLVSNKLIPELVQSFKALHPLVGFINRALF